MSGYNDDYNNYSNNNGNGDYNIHRNDNDQGTKRSFDEHDDGHNMPHKKIRRQDSRIEMRCLVPSKTAGGIIGKGGCNIKDMRETFNALIQIPDSNSPERVLQVRASPESCGEILLRVLPTINDNGSGRFRPGEVTSMSIKLLVHQSQAGGIIGVKGYKIKELREKTGAAIKVHQECAPNSTDRICIISGTPDVISQCVVFIMELLGTTPPKGPVQNFDPAFDNQNGGMNDGFGGDFRGGFGGMDQQFGGGRRGGFQSSNGGPRGSFPQGRGNFRGSGRMMGGRGGMSRGGGRDFGGMDRGGRMGGPRGGFRGGMRNSGNGGFGGRDRNDGFRGGRGGSRGGMHGRGGEGGYENY